MSAVDDTSPRACPDVHDRRRRVLRRACPPRRRGRWSSACRTPASASHGFEAPLSPELDVRCDADLYVDRLYRIGEPGRARGLPRGAPVALRVRPQPRPRRRVARRRARAPRAAQHRRARLHLGGHDERRRRPCAAADPRRMARAHGDPRRLPRRARRGARAGARAVRLRDPGRRALDAVDGPPGAQGPGPPRAPTSCRAIATAPAARPRSRATWATTFARAATAWRSTIRTRAASSPPTTAGPPTGIHAIQIELSRDLYMDEATFAIRPDGFARLQTTLADLLASLASLRL